MVKRVCARIELVTVPVCFMRTKTVQRPFYSCVFKNRSRDKFFSNCSFLLINSTILILLVYLTVNFNMSFNKNKYLKFQIVEKNNELKRTVPNQGYVYD